MKQKIVIDCLALIHLIKIEAINHVVMTFNVSISKKTFEEIETGIDKKISDLTIPDCSYAISLVDSKKISVETAEKNEKDFALKKLNLQGEALETAAIALQSNGLLISNDQKLCKIAESFQSKTANVPELVVLMQEKLEIGRAHV